MAGTNGSWYWILVRPEDFFRIRWQIIDFLMISASVCTYRKSYLSMYHTAVMCIQNQKGIIYSLINTNIQRNDHSMQEINCEISLLQGNSSFQIHIMNFGNKWNQELIFLNSLSSKLAINSNMLSNFSLQIQWSTLI